jgi:hypothetical protein
MRITQSIRWILFAVVMFALVMLTMPRPASAQIGFGVSITIGPPPLPVYSQPLCPAEGYIWVPGYWAYADGDYYWVPGTWVMAPEVGLLWTPGYWAWNGAGFIFNQGYWGPVVGFYGGINYGFGYFGEGYQGGRWNNGQFYYNRTVNNINITNIHNVYTTQVTNTTVNHVSYNGGNGGMNAQPSAQDQAAARERHIAPVAAQTQQAQAARANQQLRASVNHGKPPIAATPRPGAFNGSGVVAARQAGGPYHPAANRTVAQAHTTTQAPPPPGNGTSRANPAGNRATPQPQPNAQPLHPGNGTPRPNPAVHPNDLPPVAHFPPPNTGNAQRDREYQQQQEELRARQNQERQELQQKQEQDHQRLAQQKATEARKQQLEQQHQRQTQELQQKQAAEAKQMQEEQRQHQARSPKQEHPPTEKP